ncbi:Crp/Fnr family transcriptional regulator [Paucibacter sp. APW11]|uniref:Crp/Fnr family transcriptional regulator n=1 Tax=Roseateles aquae TaxID=3077235 RepID=A0ABU3P615_9BURK|nr:Crp/Fnr family transcriptional regulator [Paucibacter sp. APW11]MDT8998020.1 Crp/Fnr family transcriptional regulator [Paucibacter sp. APW11]
MRHTAHAVPAFRLPPTALPGELPAPCAGDHKAAATMPAAFPASQHPASPQPAHAAAHQALRRSLTSANATLPAEALLAELAGAGQLLRFVARQTLFSAGDADPALWLLISGKVSLGKHDAQGRWWQSREFGPGDWIDLHSAWLAQAHAETAQAPTPAVALVLPIDTVERCCDRHPELALALLRCMAQRARGITLDRQALLTKDINGRLAGWLLEQSAQAGQSDELQLQVQKKDLASQLGVTPETISRCLRALHEQGITSMDRYQLRIVDRAALQALAERQPSRYSR